jgi:hypothetical protein
MRTSVPSARSTPTDEGFHGMKGLTLMTALLAALALAHPGAAPAQPRPTKSLCRPSEAVLFTCEVGTRTVSICGQEQGGAVYRYGRPARVELEVTDLHLARKGWSGGGETQVYADTPTHRYIVYNRIVRTGFGADGHFDPRETVGLIVQSEGRTVSKRECALLKVYDPLTAVFNQELTRKLVPEGDYVPH